MMKLLKNILLVVGLMNSINGLAQKNDFVKGELLIQINPSSSSLEIFRQMEQDLFLTIESSACISPVMNIYQLRFSDSSLDLNRIISYCNSTTGIMVAQKNHYVYERETIPSDTLFDEQWHHKNTGQTGGTVDADIDSPEAWDITTGGLTTHGDTIVVCIIEGSGVDINHIDLKDNIWKNYAEIPDNGIDDDNNGYVDDYLGWHVITLNDVITAGTHGTRVAGMIGATGDNITGVSGVNWDVKMMIVQGQQASNEATVIAAYSYPLSMRKRYNDSQGQEGAFVVATSSSWGIDGGSPADSPLWCAMYDSLGYYGVLSIGATTNDNANVDVVGDLPTTCPSEYLVAVTMTNSQDLRASSGYGTTNVDLGAPGSSVRTTSISNAYSTTSGTSFATPLVTGCVALAYSAPCADFINFVKSNPADAALDMKDYLLESVDQTAGLMTEVSSGGRANVKKYIDSLLAACDPATCITPYYLNTPVVSDTSVEITWDGFATDYIVWFSLSGSPAVPTNIVAGNSLLIDTLQPCSYYTFYLQANCGVDSSSLSNPFTFQTDGCCTNPALTVVSKNSNSITLDWADVLSATSYNIRYKISTDAVWTEITNVTAPYAFTGLSGCATYDFQIHTQCADSTQGYGSTHTIATLGCGACTEQNYCDVSGYNANLEWIQSISINGFTNSTGSNGGWLQSNQIITALTPGVVYNINLTPGYSGSAFTEGFSIWIDFNYNGIFETTENILNNVTTNTTLNTIITIPLSATPGITKMRIGMRALSAPEICPISSFFGEYEDYCVYIGPQTGIDESAITSLNVYPNPATNQIQITCSEPIQSIQILDYSGKHILHASPSETNLISVDGLASGIYFVRVETASGIYLAKFIKQ
ncbi:MAG: S8 family serine peptidase [Crocinitomicaceae bacterium]|nr:S8 family serine peptidase [Crocinitomicaceae bacterium]